MIPVLEGRLAGQPPIFASVLLGSIIPAAWSFMLAARSRGLGTCWSNLHQFFEEEANALLGLPEDTTQVCLIATAYSLGTDFKVAARRPLDEVVHWNQW